MKTLTQFLRDKEEYRKEFEFSTVQRAYALLRPHLKKQRTIHIVGTNGKGSTGRALAHMLRQSGKSVGHFSSPHIMSFHERIWINGEDANDAALERAHEKLLGILSGLEEKLSYFEYATLLALTACNGCEFMVLEAGMGGEFDATNVAPKEISVLTPVGLDHQEFLGESVEEIAKTKLRSCDNTLVVAKQPCTEVYAVADAMFENYRRVQPREDFFMGGYLGENIQTAVEVLRLLGIAYDSALLEGFELFGRNYRFADNITLDVGHNPLAAQVLSKQLPAGTILVYNALADKDIKGVLTQLRPGLKRVEIIPIRTPRAAAREDIEAVCAALGIPCGGYEGIKRGEHYLVFGSFFTVESFVRSWQSDKE